MPCLRAPRGTCDVIVSDREPREQRHGWRDGAELGTHSDRIAFTTVLVKGGHWRVVDMVRVLGSELRDLAIRESKKALFLGIEIPSRAKEYLGSLLNLLKAVGMRVMELIGGKRKGLFGVGG